MKLNLKNSLLNLMLFAGLAFQASAEDFSVDDNFRHGWHEVNVGSGVLFSNLVRKDNRPNIDYALGYAQVGFMVTEPVGDGPFRGSFEVAPEVFGAGIFQGPGSYVAGATLWLRYNFVPKGWRFVPYIQGGAGVTDIDIPHKYDGKDFNFNLEAAVGFHYFIQPRCSLNVEYRLQHISNADLWQKNIGVNTDGPVVGVSFFF